jgi:hypothetical protein
MSRFMGSLFPVADATGFTLRVGVDGAVRQSDKKKYKIGPWEFERVAYLESDYVTQTSAAVFVKLLGSLWLYVETVAGKDGGRGPVQITVINGQKIGLTLNSVSQFAKGSHGATTKAISPGAVKVLQFDYAKKEWVNNAQAAHPVGDGLQQGTQHPRAGAANAV